YGTQEWRKPKLSPGQERQMVALYRGGEHTVAELFGVGRATVYRALGRNPAGEATPVPLPRVEA
ncbi:TPA: helix-turn-helix domain-containing protein, partial [Enterococcus faecium]|nr:helix-turn-helix domain-containing protein [Enterococcus faecium]